MDVSQNLTEEQYVTVKAYCDKIDKFLAKFKEIRKLKAVTFIDGFNIFEVITSMKEGDIKSAVIRYLVSCDEIFEIFTLVWKSLVKRNASTFLHLRKLSDLSSGIGNLTDGSDEFCLAFGEKGLLNLLMRDLRTSNLGNDLTSFALTIIYNCCWRVPENRVICREFTDILQECSQSEKAEIQADAFLALSYIVDKSEVHKISMNEPCLKFLLLALKSAMSASDRRSPVYGYSALEVLQGLNQLAINDSNKLLIVSLGGIDVLERILMEEGSTNDERLWAARAIWQLAFKEENKVNIRQRKTLLDALKAIKETTENGEVLEACSGALFVINDVLDIDDVEKGHTTRREDRGDGSGESEVLSSGRVEGHIMISYQHASQERMLQVKKYLEQCGYNVWMDVDKMSGDILDAMAKAVQRASVVLVCMTRKFKESQHCRTEATYAYTLKKDIIPLMLQDHFSPEDWLGALVGMKKWYPMFSDQLMGQCLPDLVKELGDRGKHDLVVPVFEEVTGTSFSTDHGQIQANSTADDEVDCRGGMKDDKPTDRKDKKNSRSEKSVDIDTWDEEKAGEWLKSNGVDTSKDGFKKVNGIRLMQIKNLLHLAPEFCLKTLKEELCLDLWDVLSLVDALKEL